MNRTLQMLLRYVVDSLNCMADDGIPSTIKASQLSMIFFKFSFGTVTVVLLLFFLLGSPHEVLRDDSAGRLEIPQTVPEPEKAPSNRKDLFQLPGNKRES